MWGRNGKSKCWRKKCAKSHLSENWIVFPFPKAQQSEKENFLLSLCLVGTVKILWKWLDVFEICIWIYWNEKFTSTLWSLTEKINLSEGNFHHFLDFSSKFSFLSDCVERFFFAMWQKVCCFHCGFGVWGSCLFVWVMKRSQKFPVLYYAFMARRFVRQCRN